MSSKKRIYYLGNDEIIILLVWDCRQNTDKLEIY